MSDQHDDDLQQFYLDVLQRAGVPTHAELQTTSEGTSQDTGTTLPGDAESNLFIDEFYNEKLNGERPLHPALLVDAAQAVFRFPTLIEIVKEVWNLLPRADQIQVKEWAASRKLKEIARTILPYLVIVLRRHLRRIGLLERIIGIIIQRLLQILLPKVVDALVFYIDRLPIKPE